MVRSKQIPKKCAEPSVKSKRIHSDIRFRPGSASIRDFRRYRRVIDLLFNTAAFARLVREIAQDIQIDFRFKSAAILALQHASESHLVELFKDSRLCAAHAGRVTVYPKDMQLAQHLQEKI